MYCAKCGNTISNKLNYCNSCGGKLTNDSTDSQNVILISLIISLGLFSIVGLVGLIGFLSHLFDRGVKDETILFVAVSFLLIIFGIAFIIGKQISKIIDNKATKNTQNAETVFQPQLAAPITGQLQESKMRPMSVTENTTKTLDEVLLKR
jgi:ABC-type nickel/cobalt efflux system permease component RcnA